MDNINKRKLGSKKEQEAANFLKTKGYSDKKKRTAFPLQALVIGISSQLPNKK